MESELLKRTLESFSGEQGSWQRGRNSHEWRSEGGKGRRAWLSHSLDSGGPDVALLRRIQEMLECERGGKRQEGHTPLPASEGWQAGESCRARVPLRRAFP